MVIQQFIRRHMLMLILPVSSVLSQNVSKPLILQEITWSDVQEYLKKSDMVIIPIGSTEQHGPHLPLGTDYYEATDIAGMISERTGTLVAPVLWVGYSSYHSGFPGTLSLKPETLVDVLFQTAEMLIQYGFRRFMFFNYHGGNNIIQQQVIHRINHMTEAIAIAIGIGGPVQYDSEGEFFDWHAGKNETSIMLYLRPELVQMTKAEKPVITIPSDIQKIWELAQENPALADVAGSMLGVPSETKKGGASHELSSNGIWSLNDPQSATQAIGQKVVERMVETAVRFIEDWKKISR